MKGANKLRNEKISMSLLWISYLQCPGYICPVCFWENDPFITSDNEPSDSNHGTTLKEAKSNFLQFGACVKEMLRYVRPPRDDEKEIS